MKITSNLSSTFLRLRFPNTNDTGLHHEGIANATVCAEGLLRNYKIPSGQIFIPQLHKCVPSRNFLQQAIYNINSHTNTFPGLEKLLCIASRSIASASTGVALDRQFREFDTG